MKRLLSALFLLSLSASAQPAADQSAKYWITFCDKNPAQPPSISARTLSQRQAQHLPDFDITDLPIDPAYLAQLQQRGVSVVCRSRWLNAVSAMLTPAQQQQVAGLSFVQNVSPVDVSLVVNRLPDAARNPQLAPVMTQIQGEEFAKAGLTGRFVNIGVIDAGFFGADSVAALRHINQRAGFRAVHDYVAPQRTQNRLFRTLDTPSDFHGTEVLAAISGLDPARNQQYGLATDAQFYLARTDQGNREFRGEEDNWIQAIEWMDSVGVRLVNTSLGYARGMTNPADNYRPDQMDGHTSRISQAAQLATDKKGMLVIVSAGNEGDDKNWRVISTPADAPGVMAIGATNARLWNRIGYSSIGPDFLDYLKPNVACFSLYGTSLAAPVITGFAACLMQADPSLTNKELIDIIQQSAHLYPFGNTFVGYGVPQASRALALLKKQPLPVTSRSLTVTGPTLKLSLPDAEPVVSLFRKRDTIHVIQQEAAKVLNGTLTLKRQPNEARTTVDLKREVVEVIWE
jgi:subtilisin family serine protease